MTNDYYVPIILSTNTFQGNRMDPGQRSDGKYA